MSNISTHVLDTSAGKPAAGLHVRLEIQTGGREGEPWKILSQSVTDSGGRAQALLPAGVPLAEGIYRLTFETAHYFRALNQNTFYAEVRITFFVADATQHYHVPLLLSPFGYSTYRGS
jgi:5-hydroxyisourate hydrolase